MKTNLRIETTAANGSTHTTTHTTFRPAQAFGVWAPVWPETPTHLPADDNDPLTDEEWDALCGAWLEAERDAARWAAIDARAAALDAAYPLSEAAEHRGCAMTTMTTKYLTIDDAGQRVTLPYDGPVTPEAINAYLGESDDWSSDRVPWWFADADGTVLRGVFVPPGDAEG
jgi:hypothetical protein